MNIQKIDNINKITFEGKTQKKNRTKQLYQNQYSGREKNITKSAIKDMCNSYEGYFEDIITRNIQKIFEQYQENLDNITRRVKRIKR